MTTSSSSDDSTTSRPYYPYETPPDTLWFLWEFLLLAAVYILCMLIFIMIVFLIIHFCVKPHYPTPHTPIPGHFDYVEEVKLNTDNQKLLGVNEVTSAFMIASEMRKKSLSIQTIQSLATEEESEECPQQTQEPEEPGSRPGSGILQETLEEIEKEETLVENEINEVETNRDAEEVDS